MLEKKESKVIKKLSIVINLLENCLISLFIFLLALIIMAIPLFIFDKFHIKHQFIDYVHNIQMYTIMSGFLIPASIALVCLVLYFIYSVRAKKILEKNEVYLAADNKLDKANLARTVSIAHDLAGDSSVNAADIATTVYGMSFLRGMNKKIENLTQKENIKINLFLTKIPIFLAIIIGIMLDATVIANGLYSKQLILSNRQETISQIEKAYENMNTELEYSLVDNKQYKDFMIRYNNIRMAYELDEYGKIIDFSYNYNLYVNNETIDNNFINNIEKNMNELQNQTYLFSNYISNSNIINGSIVFTDEMRSFLLNTKEKNKLSEYNIDSLDKKYSYSYSLEYYDSTTSDGDYIHVYYSFG